MSQSTGRLHGSTFPQLALKIYGSVASGPEISTHVFRSTEHARDWSRAKPAVITDRETSANQVRLEQLSGLEVGRPAAHGKHVFLHVQPPPAGALAVVPSQVNTVSAAFQRRTADR